MKEDRRQKLESRRLLNTAFRLLSSVFCLLSSSVCFAATTNCFINGSFERVGPLGNLWDGVDSRGRLTVLTRSQPIIVEGASATNILFACSPNFVDLDGDGRKDLVVGDSAGFVWWFKNYGEKGKPAFKTGQFFPSFFGTACKLHATDWNGDGLIDLVIGDAEGHAYVLLNIGNKAEPKFTTAMAKPRIGVYGYLHDTFDAEPIRYGKKPLLIGNYACPWVADWNGDGRPDLLVGEGTYSANSVWIFLNSGSAQNPAFDDASKHSLVYGEGREQLTPAVVDWDGDGNPDLLVGEREGRLCFYRGKPRAAGSSVAAIQGKVAPAILDFTGHINIGTQTNFNGVVCARPCDWNDDGLPDLLIGRPDGHLQVAINTGTRNNPIIGPAQDIMGTDTERDSEYAVRWGYAYSLFSNSSFFAEALQSDAGPGGEKIQPKNGKYFLKFAYRHSYPGYNMFWEANANWSGLDWLSRTWELGGKWLRTPTTPLVIGKNYTFSFWYRGKDIKLNWVLGMVEAVENPAKRGTGSWEVHKVEGNVGAGPSWQQFTRTFLIPGSKASRGQDLPFDLYLQMVGTGQIYLDDFRLEGPQ